jgi:Neuraminidase (sialidase)
MRTYVGLGLAFALVLALAVLAGGTPAYAWSYPAALNTNAATDSGIDFSPQVTTDGAGNWVAVWESNDSLGGTIGGDFDILVARSTDYGATWTAPATLNTNAATDSGDDVEPQVTTDGAGHWVAVWMSLDNLGGTIGGDGDILVARSTDNGATWTAPAALNTNAATDSGLDWYPQVTTDGGGNWLAVWMSLDNLGGTIGEDYDILVARSTDNGATWTAPAALNANAATDSGWDEDPQVTTDGAGNWLAVWDSNENLGGTIGTDYDILVARSTDNGATWTAPAALNTNAATDSGGDAAPQVTTDGAGHWVAVWSFGHFYPPNTWEEKNILVARSTDNGATWTAPAPLNTNAATDSGWNVDPQVTTDGGGNWVAVWQSAENLGGTIGTDDDIQVARSTDNGATWTAPAALNTNAATDSGGDWLPQVTTDGAGNWLAVWYSWDSLGGTIGWDYDILYATEYISPYPSVGGVVEMRVDDSGPAVGVSADSSGASAGRNFIALAALAAALVALGAGGWYARRRRLG